MTRHNISTALLGLTEEEMRRKGSQRGRVVRRGDTWHIYFRRFTVNDKGNVKWGQTSREVGSVKEYTKRQAEQRGYDLFVSKANGLTITPGASATVGEFWDAHYEVEVLPHLAKSTRYAQASLYRKHVAPSLAHCQLGHVNRAMVQTLISGKQRSGLSSQTVAHIRNLLSSLFRHAKRLNYFAGELPTEDLVLGEIRHEERRPLTRDQFAILRSQLPEERLKVLVDVLAHLGLRIGEAAGLKWKCVNLGDAVQYLEDGTPVPPLSLVIREQYHRNEFSRLKTDGSKGTLPLTSDVWVSLSEWFERSKFTAPEDTVFAGTKGRPLDAHNEAARRLKPAAIKAGLPWVSWHTLRHTASTWADQVLTMREKMDLLRHKSVEVSLGYGKADLDRIRQKLEQMSTSGKVM